MSSSISSSAPSTSSTSAASVKPRDSDVLAALLREAEENSRLCSSQESKETKDTKESKGLSASKEKKKRLTLSAEQLKIIGTYLGRDLPSGALAPNMKIVANAGAAKSTTMLYCADADPSKKILLLTYNKQLQLDTKKRADEMELSNIEIRTYHSAAGRAYGTTVPDDVTFLKLIRNNPYPSNIHLLSCDVLMIDEAQDMTMSYYFLVEKIVASNPNVQVLVVGDARQAINAYKGARVEFLTKCNKLPGFNSKIGRPWSENVLTTSYRLTPAMANFVNHHLGLFPGRKSSSSPSSKTPAAKKKKTDPSSSSSSSTEEATDSTATACASSTSATAPTAATTTTAPTRCSARIANKKRKLDALEKPDGESKDDKSLDSDNADDDDTASSDDDLESDNGDVEADQMMKPIVGGNLSAPNIKPKYVTAPFKLLAQALSNVLAEAIAKYGCENVMVLTPNLTSLQKPGTTDPLAVVLNSNVLGCKIHMQKDRADGAADPAAMKGKLLVSSWNATKGQERDCCVVVKAGESYFQYCDDKWTSPTTVPNVLYVATTRARKELILVEENSKTLRTIDMKRIYDDVEMVTVRHSRSYVPSHLRDADDDEDDLINSAKGSALDAFKKINPTRAVDGSKNLFELVRTGVRINHPKAFVNNKKQAKKNAITVKSLLKHLDVTIMHSLVQLLDVKIVSDTRMMAVDAARDKKKQKAKLRSFQEGKEGKEGKTAEETEEDNYDDREYGCFDDSEDEEDDEDEKDKLPHLPDFKSMIDFPSTVATAAATSSSSSSTTTTYKESVGFLYESVIPAKAELLKNKISNFAKNAHVPRVVNSIAEVTPYSYCMTLEAYNSFEKSFWERVKSAYRVAPALRKSLQWFQLAMAEMMFNESDYHTARQITHYDWINDKFVDAAVARIVRILQYENGTFQQRIERKVGAYSIIGVADFVSHASAYSLYESLKAAHYGRSSSDTSREEKTLMLNGSIWKFRCLQDETTDLILNLACHLALARKKVGNLYLLLSGKVVRVKFVDGIHGCNEFLRIALTRFDDQVVGDLLADIEKMKATFSSVSDPSESSGGEEEVSLSASTREEVPAVAATSSDITDPDILKYLNL